MKITIITLFPNMILGFFEESIVKRAQEKGLVELEIINLREFAKDRYGSVDDRPYGGGVGMVLRADIVSSALQKVKNPHFAKAPRGKQKSKIVLTSARGKVFSQRTAQEYSKLSHMIILAGHYEGFDERISKYIDEEVSIGDFVLTGGELVASAIVDAVVRLIPGVLKKEDASQIESFFSVPIERLIEVLGEDEILKKLKQNNMTEITLLEFPQYTRPEEVDGLRVPEVLLNGNHKEIENWRLKKAFEETLKRRPDLLDPK